jgi:hypothetical protein
MYKVKQSLKIFLMILNTYITLNKKLNRNNNLYFRTKLMGFLFFHNANFTP